MPLKNKKIIEKNGIKKNTNADRGEKRGNLQIAGGSINLCRHYSKKYGGFSKNKTAN